MRALIIAFSALVLAGCSVSCPQPTPTVVVPPGSTVMCPSGSPAVFANGAYRC